MQNNYKIRFISANIIELNLYFCLLLCIATSSMAQQLQPAQETQSHGGTKEPVISQSLQSKEEAAATFIAEVQAKWRKAATDYATEVEKAKSLILIQLEKMEAKARTAGQSSSVEKAKIAKERFIATGTLPIGVSAKIYETKISREKDRLKGINKSLVKTLLLNQHDDQAKALERDLPIALNQLANYSTLDLTFDNGRTAWNNRSYNTVLYHRQGDVWEEMNAAGKREREVKEISRNSEYIELLLVDRQHKIRLYEKRADMFKDGRWQWVCHGEWISKK